MLNLRVGLNLVTLKNGRDAAALPDNLERLRRAGFQGVGLWVQTIQEWLDSGRTVEQLAGETKSRGLEVHELCFVPVLDEAGKVADRRRTFEHASALGAGAVICIYGNPEAPLEKVRQDWSSFVRNVEDLRVPAAFEFIGPWPQYNSPLGAWRVIQAGPELGTIVLDTFHFWRGGCDLSQIGQVPARRISLVHLNDVKDVPQAKAVDADRTFPGEGILPLKEVLRGLAAEGFTGPLSVEIFGEAQQQDPDEVSLRAYRCTAGLLEQL
jgi:2-keto-myo-inositol isomerase